MHALSLRHVSKRYGSLLALDDVSFDVARGEIVALLGPNGAGKTTALDILLGLRHASSGQAHVNGTLGATPQNTGFPDTLRVRELVEFAAAHDRAADSVTDILAAFDLVSLAAKKAGDLSGGQQRRVALALAFACKPDIVVLDEPSTGLDVEARRDLWAQLRARVGGERTALFTTHYLEEAQALATRIIVLAEGCVRFDGAPNEFRATLGRRRVEYVADDGSNVVIPTDDADECVRRLVREGVAFHDLLVTQPSFEDVFLHLLGGPQ